MAPPPSYEVGDKGAEAGKFRKGIFGSKPLGKGIHATLIRWIRKMARKVFDL